MAHYDAIVIGTGQAGPSLAVKLAKAGRKTAIIERDRVGGTCVNVGCIPTKTLVASARVAEFARRGGQYGVVLNGPVQVDMALVQHRMDEVRRESNRSLTKWLLETPDVTLIRGHARFSGPNAIEVDAEVLEADEIFLNVGARASIPDIAGLKDIEYLTNSSILELKALPDHLLILGGSYIGLEFAQMYRRFGCDVSVLELGPHLIGREDVAVSTAIETVLRRDGIHVYTGISGLSLSKSGGSISASFDAGGKATTLAGSHFLLAVGRRPNTDDLAADRAGIKLDARGYVEVDDALRTSVEHIWALGDVNGKGGFTHTAYNDYEIVAANLLDGANRKVSDRIAAYALYIDPPLARIGLSPDAVRRTRRPALTAKMMMTRVGRARERGETDGFMQIVVDAENEQILGATLFGIEADEVIHCILDLMYAKASWRVLQRAMHIHPTVSELLPTLLADLAPLA